MPGSSMSSTSQPPVVVLCHAYVEYESEVSCEYALRMLHLLPLFGTRMKVEVAGDRARRRAMSGAGRLYVGNLPAASDWMDLRELFGRFGKVLDARTGSSSSSSSSSPSSSSSYPCFGFVDLETVDQALAAIATLSGSTTALAKDSNGRLLRQWHWDDDTDDVVMVERPHAHWPLRVDMANVASEEDKRRAKELISRLGIPARIARRVTEVRRMKQRHDQAKEPQAINPMYNNNNNNNNNNHHYRNIGNGNDNHSSSVIPFRGRKQVQGVVAPVQTFLTQQQPPPPPPPLPVSVPMPPSHHYHQPPHHHHYHHSSNYYQQYQLQQYQQQQCVIQNYSRPQSWWRRQPPPPPSPPPPPPPPPPSNPCAHFPPPLSSSSVSPAFGGGIGGGVTTAHTPPPPYPPPPPPPPD